MATVVQDVSGDSALQTAIAALKAKIEGAEESSDIDQLVNDINTALAGKQNTLTFDSAPSSGSSNPVTSDGVKTALDGKQDTLTFDSEPTAESAKPVTSGGVKEALDDMYSEISDRIAAAEEAIDISGSGIYESASGSIVSVSDGADNKPMKSAVVTMEPIQDLHGYDSPWPAGGGKNRIDFSDVSGTAEYFYVEQKTNFVLTAGVTYTVSFDITSSVAPFNSSVGCGTSSAYQIDIATKNNNNSGRVSITFTPTDEQIARGEYLWLRAIRYISRTTFNWSISNVMVELGSEATSYAPYENICPISGRTGLNVVRAGKNLLPSYAASGSESGVTWTVGQNGTIVVNGTASKTVIINAPFSSWEWDGVTQCWLSGCPDGGSDTTYALRIGGLLATQFSIACYNSVGCALQRSGYAPLLNEPIRFQIIIRSGTTCNNLTFTPQLEYGTAKSNYEPYQGSSYSVNWETEAGTVYGGTLNAVSGKLVVDRAYIASYSGETLPSTWISDRDVYAEGTTPTTGAQVVYKLANSVEYQLTPQEITTLIGANNIWSDAGNMAIEYPADTKTYIDNKIAEAIAAAMA